MLFNSWEFILLVLSSFGLYYCKPLQRYQVSILLVASLIFYAFNSFNLLLLLLLSALINIVVSYYVVYGKPNRRKVLAISGVIVNLALLAAFKYASLIGDTFFSLPDSVSEFLISIPLPVGISFYTFQGISLLVDVFKADKTSVKEIIPPSLFAHGQRTLFFISFFPQLVAGPIVKAHEFYYQIKTKYITDIQWESAFRSIILGYFLKMVLADNLKDYTLWISYPQFESQSSIVLIVLLLGFSFQIFADFAGYSAIAIGVSKLYGYNIPENFNYPYISSSFKEFWARWHISLSSFLREYLYFPLGGNRKGKLRTFANLIIVMFLGGLWHGALWSYAVWGLFHGLLLAVERVYMDFFKLSENGLVVNARRLMVFILVTVGWLFFKLTSFSEAMQYLQAIGQNIFSPTDDSILLMVRIFLYSLPVVLMHWLYLVQDTPIIIRLRRYEYILYGLMLFLIATNSGTSSAFIYFQF